MAYNNTQDNPFWHFACTVYDAPNKTTNLLFLQDNYAANVLITLLMMWFDHKQQALSLSNIATLLSLLTPLEKELIAPCRELRRSLKLHLPESTMYQQAKTMELQLEHFAAEQLHTQAQHLIPSHETFSKDMNLYRYLVTIVGVPIDDVTKLALDL